MPGGAHAVGAVEAAEPVELQRVEARAGGAEQRRERQRRMDDPDRGAVLRGLRIEIVGGEEPAGARHALHDEVRLAGEMVAHVLRQQAGIFRIAAGDAGAQQDADGLALEEGRVLRCWWPAKVLDNAEEQNSQRSGARVRYAWLGRGVGGDRRTGSRSAPQCRSPDRGPTRFCRRNGCRKYHMAVPQKVDLTWVLRGDGVADGARDVKQDGSRARMAGSGLRSTPS